MPYDDVLVVQVRAPDFLFVLAACSEHASGRSIVWSSNHLANDAKLPPSDHILDARYVVEHLTNFLVSYSALLDIAYREVKYPSYIPMEEDFELT